MLSYLPDEHAIDQALTAIAQALRPGGLFAIDICDLAYGQARHDAPPAARVHDDWAIITRFSLPAPRPVRPRPRLRKETKRMANNDRLFLITSATGRTGEPAVRLLMSRGHRVRAFVHEEHDRSRQLAAEGAEIVAPEPTVLQTAHIHGSIKRDGWLLAEGGCHDM